MKDCLIIGNTNAAACKEIFPLIKENKLWLGNNKITDFNTGAGEIKGVYAAWFSTFPVTRKPLILTATYSPEKYPVYDNYNAINVGKVCDIPMDYDGVMGVPISFLMFHCPEQFEIIGIAQGSEEMAGECYLGIVPTIKYDGGKARAYVDGKPVYCRIFIRKRN